MTDKQELKTASALIREMPDFDLGPINTYGGGNTDWWLDYVRSIIGQVNDYWRDNALASIELADTRHTPEAIKDEDQSIPEIMAAMKKSVDAIVIPKEKQ